MAGVWVFALSCPLTTQPQSDNIVPRSITQTRSRYAPPARAPIGNTTPKAFGATVSATIPPWRAGFWSDVVSIPVAG